MIGGTPKRLLEHLRRITPGGCPATGEGELLAQFLAGDGEAFSSPAAPTPPP